MNAPVSAGRLLLETFSEAFTVENLSRPDRIAWPESQPEFERLLEELKNRIPPTLHPLCDLSAAAHILLNRSGTSDDSFKDRFLETALSGLLPSAVCCDRSAVWRLMPVCVVGPDRKAAVLSFLIGALSCPVDGIFPEWACGLLEDAAQSAVSDAFQAARCLAGKDLPLFAFPLLSPYRSGRIEGCSIGLPIALAALSALTGETLADHLIATGGIEPMPPVAVRPVADISIKAEKACGSGYRLMLIPSTGETPRPRDGMTVKPVDNLRQAWLWARFHAPGREKDLDLITLVWNDPVLWIDNCLSLHPDFLKLSLEDPHIAAEIRGLMGQGHHAETLCNRLAACLDAARGDLVRAEILGGLFADDVHFGAFCTSSPLTAFQWAVLNVKRANHCGDNRESLRWQKRADGLRSTVVRADPKRYADFINNRCVAEHNTYTFSPDPPAELLQALREEERHAGRGVNVLLGGLYGTLAQHHAFCGPEHLDSVIHYVELSQRAFGGGVFPEYRKDWLRGWSYRMFAYLDAGRMEDAREALCRYLEIADGSMFPGWHAWKNPFQRFALVRWLADRLTIGCHGEMERRIAEGLLAEALPHELPNRHPAQLIAWNVGRIALKCGCRRTARTWLEDSIHRCERGGETIRPMGLLPLAALHAAGLWMDRYETRFERIQQEIRRSTFLNRMHFRDVLEGGAADVLDRIHRQPQRWFPFTYR